MYKYILNNLSKEQEIAMALSIKEEYFHVWNSIRIRTYSHTIKFTSDTNHTTQIDGNRKDNNYDHERGIPMKTPEQNS